VGSRSGKQTEVGSIPLTDRTWTVEDHHAGRDSAVIGLYERLLSLVRACGPFILSVSKTAITFKGSRRGFAGAKPKDDGSTVTSTFNGG